MTDYAELHAISNFTFLRGASHPEELVSRAAELGYRALALTDECSLAGVVRAHLAARECAVKLLIGSEFELGGGTKLVLLAPHRKAYGQLSRLITRARRAAPKGDYRLSAADLDPADLDTCLAIVLPPPPISMGSGSVSMGSGSIDPETAVSMGSGSIDPETVRQVDQAGDQSNLTPLKTPLKPNLTPLKSLVEGFGGRVWLGVELLRGVDDAARLRALRDLGERLGVPLVAAGGVHMHARSRRVLQDTLTAVRHGTTLAEAGFALSGNGERHLRRLDELNAIYAPELLEQTLEIAARCRFSLDELRYEYPEELVPDGVSPGEHLRRLTERGMRRRWPQGVPPEVAGLVEHELALIAVLGYEPYFLTVYDIVRFARGRDILCQGRGSAANSAVCYCLGITEVDPARMQMLFERFISRERNEPPDIDVDFEHERREEVIQYIYRKYGRERAALAATVITYQPRSAIRDVGKALGLDRLQVDRLAGSTAWWDGRRVLEERFAELGLDPRSPVLRRLAVLVSDLIGFPRHLSQHTGGFVISRGRLSSLVPVENAAMPERTVIQWDKDDLEALGLLKVDVLGLGILSAIHRCFDLVNGYRDAGLGLSTVPPEDPGVYAMIGHADTVGVFQIESRAQMAMLPRMKPDTFYDLVIEVAIVRPGPIQGGMVHPYLRRRRGEEPVSYPSEAVRGVLERTLGVPIFQEQAMQLAVVAAGFTPGEADALRRAMAAWRRRGGLGPFEQRLISGMRERGYSEDFARQIFNQIQGFGEYGFPESHSASFALLVYVSAWLKHHEPAAFTCALLNSQPMGFYAPAQLIRDARLHGVEVRPVSVADSRWDCTLEPGRAGGPALRLGMRMIKGLRRESCDRIVAAGPACGAGRRFRDTQDLARRAGLSTEELDRLACAGALQGLAGNRHAARWSVLGVAEPSPIFEDPRFAEGTPLLPVPSEGENLVADYRALDFTLGRHPLALLRDRLQALRVSTAAEVGERRHGEFTRAAGLVINRQRPATASGVIFMTLEDETGYINVIIWPWVAQRRRHVTVTARLVVVSGTIEREGEVVHLVAGTLDDKSGLLGRLPTRSRDFH